MKKIIPLVAGVLLTTQLFAQTEFKTYENGLIYNETTMSKLGHIVDSLNLKFKLCDMDKVFASKQQTIAHIIEVDTGDVDQARKDIEQQMPFEEFVAKYPLAKIERNVLVVKYAYSDYEDKKWVEYSEVDVKGYGFELREENKKGMYNSSIKNRWVSSYYGGSSYSKPSVNAFYFPEDFKSIPLPLKYCRQIGYSDCLIDTTTTKLLDDAKEGWVTLPKDWQNLPLKQKQKLLKDMRSTRVIGQCSMDDSPRTHAVNIALLSAETASWEVFLKSHLDIMN